MRSWPLGAGVEPRGCGKRGIMRQESSLNVDVTCSGDVAVVRWVIWRSFLNRECDRQPRSTRSIGPDLRCPMPKEDSHARVIASGIESVDLQAGTARPIELVAPE